MYISTALPSAVLRFAASQEKVYVAKAVEVTEIVVDCNDPPPVSRSSTVTFCGAFWVNRSRNLKF